MPEVTIPDRVRVSMFEVSVTPLGATDTARLVEAAARSGVGLTIGNLNLHGVYVHHTDADFANYCAQADLVLIDGAPIAWAARLPTTLRVGSTDWLDEFMPIARGLQVLAVGGTPEASRGAEQYFRRNFPDVGWVGVDGYSSQEPDKDLLAKIAAADLVLVGMGMPRQERWILRHQALLTDKVVANVGGCFDYYAGVQSLAPRWMGRFGIEWLYRLAASPGRLAHRYLIEPGQLIVLLARIKLARRRAS